MNREQILGVFRHVLTLVGGALVTRGIFDEQLMLEAVGAVMAVAGFLWSLNDKR
jgi:hypothetical protein